jgi:hypothetical protein
MRIAFLAVALALLAPGAALAQTRVQIAVDNLASRDGLGGNVSAVLNLQVWKTLRRAPFPNPRQLDFGSGVIYWFEDGTSVYDPETAQALVETDGYDLLLWGAAQTYGDGVAVDVYLTAPRERMPLATWTLKGPGGGQGASLSLAPPRDLYAFAPVLLTRAVVQAYTSPGALFLCSAKTLACADRRPVGPGMVAMRQEGEWSYIRPHDGAPGWLRTPDIGAGGNDITNFAGAMVSYGRGDFEQAARLFRRVAASPTAGPAMGADAAGLAALALERFGDPGAQAYVEAEIAHRDVAPFLLQAAVMQAFSQGDRARAAAYVTRASVYLDDDDPWLLAARRLSAGR